MKISIYFCYIAVIFSISTTSTSSYPKSSNDNKFSLSSDNDAKVVYSVKRKAPNPKPPSFVSAYEEQPLYADSSRVIRQPVARYRRVEKNYDRKSRASLENELNLKRTSLLNGLNKRADTLYKRDLKQQRREDAYGIVYGNGKPIGILEPFPQAYELSPMYNSREGIEEIEPCPQVYPRAVMDMLYTDRLASNSGADWESNDNNVQDPVKYTNIKHPPVVNDYKITSKINDAMSYKNNNNEHEKVMKLANNLNPATTKRDSKLNENQKKELDQKDPELVTDDAEEPDKAPEVKRSAVGITDEKIDKLKFALNRMQNPGPSDSVEEIEDNLRDILSDMGLIEGEYTGVDSFKNKRASDGKRNVDKEDENLEEGINKIELVRATHEAPVVERTKREDKKVTKNAKDVDKAKDECASKTSSNNNQAVVDNNSKPELTEIKIGEDSSQLKSEASLKSESNEDHNSEEIKMGDAKINVANYQSEGDEYIRSKRQESSDIIKGLEKSGELTVSGNKSPLACSGNDAEMEKKRNKDQTSTATSISNKTKREQAEFEYQTKIEQNIQAKIDAIKDQVKREIEALKERSTQENQRQKRDVNTLLADESSALDPQKHPDEKLVPHIRRRRNLEELQTLTRAKRGLPDYSNLKNIDSGDYLDLAGEKQRNLRETVQDYEVDPQEDKLLPEPVPNSIRDASGKKRSSDHQEGLPAAESINLNVDIEDDSTSQDDNTNIRERSVDNPLPSGSSIEKKSTHAEPAKKEIKKLDLPNLSQSGEEALQDITNEEQANVASNLQETKSDDGTPIQKRNEEQVNKVSSLQETQSDDATPVQKRNGEQANLASNLQKTKSDDNTSVQKQNGKQANVSPSLQETKSPNGTLVQKRSTDSQILPEVNSGEKEVNSKNKDQAKDKKREVEETANPGANEDLKSKRGNPKSTEKSTLNQKKDSKRNIEDLPVDLKSALQPEEQDLQETANSRRTRRQIEEEVMQNPSMVYGRRKRANAVMPYAKSSFFPYRAEEEEGDDEGDEFEEDSIEDRPNLQKREAGYNSRYNNQYRRSLDYLQDYGSSDEYSSNFQPEQKRSLTNRYVADENSDVYENPNNYFYRPVTYLRQKRQNFDQLASLHGGGPMLHHLAAVKERSMQPLDNDNRNKRNFNTNTNTQSFDNQKNKEEPESIADLSAADLFGALPQSYDGNNLLRFKRIRREISSSTEGTQSKVP